MRDSVFNTPLVRIRFNAHEVIIETLTVGDLRRENAGHPGFVVGVLEDILAGHIYDDSDSDPGGVKLYYVPADKVIFNGRALEG